MVSDRRRLQLLHRGGFFLLDNDPQSFGLEAVVAVAHLHLICR